jgi:DNA-binding GntR family transcriptional regulator
MGLSSSAETQLSTFEHADESQLSSLTREAYQRLRSLIVTLQLQPGALINEAQLMEQLALGRTPIREALQRLACEGLVVLRPRRGAFVASLNITDLHQIFEMRLVIEGQAAVLAAERATERDLAAMRATLDPLDRADASGDTQAFIDIDRTFHRALARAAHNKFLDYTLGRMYNLNLRLWYLALDRIGPMRTAIEEHRLVLEAITQHDGPAAEAAMRAHIGDFQTRIRAVL